MRLPSASAMQRAFSCPESFALPKVETESSKAATRGTTVHEFLRRVLTGEMTREEALALVSLDDHGRTACEMADLDALPRGGHYEVAVAWNPETDKARILGYDIDRNYEAHGADRETEVVGSFDILGDLVDRRVFNFDFKTGRPQWGARDSWQLRTGAVIWAMIRGADEALVGHLIVNDDVRWDLWEIDAIALADYKAQLRDQMRKIRKLKRIDDLASADVVEGEHCKYCPAFSRCPAKVGLVANISTMVRTGGPAAYLEPATAAVAWRTLDKYDDIAKRMRAEIEKAAAMSPIDLGDGYELKLAAGDDRDSITDPVKAILLLEQEIGTDAARKAAGTSKKAITAAAKLSGGQDCVTRVLGKMRDAGLLEKKPGEMKVREVRKDLR